MLSYPCFRDVGDDNFALKRQRPRGLDVTIRGTRFNRTINNSYEQNDELGRELISEKEKEKRNRRRREK